MAQLLPEQCTTSERNRGCRSSGSVLERAGIQRLTWNDAQGSIPRWRGEGGGWITEGQVLSASADPLSECECSPLWCSHQIQPPPEEQHQMRLIAEMRRLVGATVEDGPSTEPTQQDSPWDCSLKPVAL